MSKLRQFIGILFAAVCLAGNVPRVCCHAQERVAPEVKQVVEPPVKQSIFFKTRDGVRIAADYFAAAETAGMRPAIVLIHGSNRTKERWKTMGVVEVLQKENYHLLAIDIRGRGESESGNKEELRRNPGLGIFDIEAAINWLAEQEGVDSDRIALVGSSYGANLAVTGCLSQDWKVATVVCFSATAATYRMRKAFEGDFKIPSGLYLAGRKEPERYDVVGTAGKLLADTSGSAMVKIHDDPTHALSIWYHHPESRKLVVQWLRGQFKE